jgi:YfiH family protein
VNLLISPLLARLEWIDHGFGTREAPLDQDAMASLKQIHSSRTLVADRAAGCVGEGDALLSAEPGVAVSVRTADCFPILLADPKARAIAAVHAGWRGTAAGIAQSALERMRSEFGTDPADVLVAIGPGIGACCYQVGLDVARQFGMPAAGRLDLAEANRAQLRRTGVRADNLDTIPACTSCDASRFHSYRRDRDAAGRMISFIRIRNQPAAQR